MKKATSVKLDAELLQRLDHMADDRGLSRSELIAQILGDAVVYDINTLQQRMVSLEVSMAQLRMDTASLQAIVVRFTTEAMGYLREQQTAFYAVGQLLQRIVKRLTC